MHNARKNNAAQLPASLLVTLFARKLVGRKLPFVVCAALCLIALAGWIWTPVFLELVWAGLIGGTTIFIYTLAIALPALLARQEEVAVDGNRCEEYLLPIEVGSRPTSD